MEGNVAAALGIALGIGLAAATGFRVFLPFLVAGLAARAGWIPLAENFAWIASMPAVLIFGTAAVVEALAYYIPGVDHVLDVLATPATVVAGILVSASVMADVPPVWLWPVAIIAGGGIAGLMKGGAALVRAQSAVATGGLGNPVVSTVETLGAIVLSVLAILVPVLGLAAVIALLVWGSVRAGRLMFGARRK
jgi:Domain of unknown function (DUF4126)